MSRDKPVLRALRLLSLIEKNGSGLRVTDMAEQLGANARAVGRVEYEVVHVLIDRGFDLDTLFGWRGALKRSSRSRCVDIREKNIELRHHPV